MASNIGYQAVERDIRDEVVQERIALPRIDRWDDWIWNFLKGGTLSEGESVELQRRMNELGGTRNSETFLIHAESVRQIAYVLFWFKIVFAAIVTKLMISPSQIEHSDLKRMFGYNNVRYLKFEIYFLSFSILIYVTLISIDLRSL
jgi:hypothetical protein